MEEMCKRNFILEGSFLTKEFNSTVSEMSSRFSWPLCTGEILEGFLDALKIKWAESHCFTHRHYNILLSYLQFSSAVYLFSH